MKWRLEIKYREGFIRAKVEGDFLAIESMLHQLLHDVTIEEFAWCREWEKDKE